MPCIACGRDFHEECHIGCENCHPVNPDEESIKNSLGRPISEPEQVTDVHSTGRKRAAFLYPLFKDKPCEWQGKKNCGGGSIPIVGCIKGKQLHRHHGPVKNTLRNEPGQVHRICSACHSRWHAKNDGIYNEELYATLPHNPEPASEEELILNDMHYKLANKSYYKRKEQGQ